MFEEVLRIDPSNYFLHMRVNFWVALVVWILSVGFFVWWQFLRHPSTKKPAEKTRPEIFSSSRFARYRVVHRVPLWAPGERPQMHPKVIEGVTAYNEKRKPVFTGK